MTAQADMIEALGPGGELVRTLPHFVPRPSQQTMAGAVAEAIQKRSELVVEAGTGTGKTFAYLVPAMSAGMRVILSTGTKTLQDQLFYRDLPIVAQALGLKVHAALLKGRANYLCRHRLEQALSDGRLPREETYRLGQIRTWAAQTQSGDRAELAAVPEDDPIWPRVTSTTENCLGSGCPYFDRCFVVQARHQAQEADLVVVNHHLLLADLVLKQEGFGEILPGAGAFILDEAHQLPELAGQFFSEKLSYRQLEELAGDTLGEAGSVSGALGTLLPGVEALRMSLRKMRLAMQSLPERAPFAQLAESTPASTALLGLNEALQSFAEAAASQAHRSRGLTNVYDRCQRLQRCLNLLQETAANTESVRWVERSHRGFTFHLTPLDVATPLQAMRKRLHAAWIHTSATLSVASRFDHYADRLGLQSPRTLALQSPYDYAHQALCYLPPGLPEPNTRDYTTRMLEAVMPVLQASNGRAFILFTSHRALKQAAVWLHDRADWPLFVQGTAPRHRLLEEFRASGHGVLLGAASFWEGVDVIGEALSVVVIDKLPFEAPGDPVLEARLDAMRRHEANPFRDWQVPNAVIALKQGVGRLIRCESDRGILVLCDPRLTSRGYGRIFLDSLPAMPRSRKIADVQAFFTPQSKPHAPHLIESDV